MKTPNMITVQIIDAVDKLLEESVCLVCVETPFGHNVFKQLTPLDVLRDEKP
jgi:hypothetical protein